ncbi:hypothetical protein [Halodurantibacterium flavum]|uniref:Uncharacterized protein n=1 Tax=Halodurantibacterium flavum TaxID=1382802 RepID=A0ABW4S1X6_9RHOB
MTPGTPTILLLAGALAGMLGACAAPPMAPTGASTGAPTEAPTDVGRDPDARPQDEVPEQRRLPDGGREYRFSNGCVVVLEPERAVLRDEAAVCELYQRDIALLYASAD